MKNQNYIKEIFYFFLGIFLIFFFNPIFEILFNDYINEYSTSLISKTIFILLFIIVVYIFSTITINDCKKTVPNKKNTYFLFLIIIFYSYHRFRINHYIFLPYNHSIKYSDFIYVIFLLNLSNYLKLIFPPKKFQKSKLYGDSAIEDIKENELGDGLEKFVEKIHTIIKENCFSSAYSIGINSQWGDGKTSSLNILKNKLNNSIENENYIIVKFNPWLSFDGKILISDFFNSITENLINDGLSKQISSYSKELTNEDSTLYSGLKKIIPFLDNSNSLETLFNEINDNLKVLNKKLIIFIDDVDRLDNQEVYQLLKLIRNTANFTNTFFVIAYDRDYVNNAILKVNSFPSNDYLNKIINTELTLPYFDKIVLSKIFIEKVLKLIGEEYRNKIEKAVQSFDSFNIFLDGLDRKNSFGYWISNLRDVKKLADSIYINFNEILDDIDFEDMLIVEILHIRFPNVYKMISNKKDDLLYENNGTLYIKPKITNHEKRNEEISDFNKTYFNYFINDLIRKGHLLREDKDKVIELFRKLFQLQNKTGISFTNSESLTVEFLKANKARKFERYFAQIISRENINEKDWNEILNSESENNRHDLVEKLTKEGKEEDLIERLTDIKNFDNIINFENIIKTIFQLSRSESKLFTGKINIGSNVIIDKFSFPNKTTKEIIQKNTSRIKKILLENLADDNHFNIELLITIYEKSPYKVLAEEQFNIFTREELHEILKNYALKYFQREGVKGENFWDYYHAGKKIDYVEVRNGDRVEIKEIIYLDADIKELIIEQGKKDIEIFLKFFIDKDFRHEKLFGIRRNFINIVFDNLENFENFIKTQDNNNAFVKKFNAFYFLSKKDNFMNYKEFDFGES